MVNALTLSVLAVFRAAQNLRFEAVFKLALGISWPLATIAAARLAPTATAVVAGMSVVSLAALLGLLPLVPGNAILRARRSARGALRAAAPLGLMAAATLVYFRSGTIMLGAWGTSAETAAFTVASTIGFGLLALPNAITTALLPRLSFETNVRVRVTAVRQALASGFVCCSLAAAATVVLGGPLIVRAFGAEYRSAETPLVILAFATVLIALNGMLGVALIALRRLRILGAQVAVSLAANLVATALLVPRAGAVGAAWAVVVTEVVGLLVLAPACARALPGLYSGADAPARRACRASRRRGGALTLPRLTALASAAATAPRHVRSIRPLALVRVRGVVLVGVGFAAVLLALEAYAASVDYGLRVTSDVPTFLALLRDSALHPLTPVSPFLAVGGIETSHATPYMQLLAWLWQLQAGHGAGLVDPIGAYRFLAVVGAFVSLLVLHAFYLWSRGQAGARAAWVALPILLVLFGPAHVIWAGDLTFHGFLYASSTPRRLPSASSSTRSCLSTRSVSPSASPPRRHSLGPRSSSIPSRGRCSRCSSRSSACAAPISGNAAGGSAARRSPARSASHCCGRRISIDRALAIVVPHGALLVVLAAAAPVLARYAHGSSLVSRARLPRIPPGFAAKLPWLLAAVGLVGVVALAGWEAWLIAQPGPNPLVHSNRLALYWVEDRWRWPLMLCAGAAGAGSLVRIARAGRPVPAAWLTPASRLRSPALRACPCRCGGVSSSSASCRSRSAWPISSCARAASCAVSWPRRSA